MQKLAQRSRSIEILDKDFLPKPTYPLLGNIAAGVPIEAIEEAQQFTLEELMPLDPGNSYLLRVTGQSIIEDHIADGDLVIVEPRNAARDGEIVVAQIDGEATLKRLYREGPEIYRLQPANSTMSPIFVRPPQKLEIRGVVRGVLRRYSSPARLVVWKKPAFARFRGPARRPGPEGLRTLPARDRRRGDVPGPAPRAPARRARQAVRRP